MSLFFRAETRECRRCGRVFTAKGKQHYYCSEECRRQGSPKVTQVCENCGREFEIEQYLVKRGQGKFCSLDCYHSQKPRVERICQVCGKVFTVRASYAAAGWGQFCSQECQRRSYEARRATRICEVCGKEFSVIQAVAKKKDTGKYCSKECHDAGMRDYVTMICVECGKQVSIPRSDVNRGRGKFCSRECFDRHVDAQVTLTCANCGKEFETSKSQIEHRGRRFCSRRCYQLYEGESSIEQLVRIELERQGEEFVQEAGIGPYNVDFFLPRRNLVIECDGSYWHSLIDSIIRDRRKNTFLNRQGYRIFRLSEEDIRKSPSDCVKRVLIEA